MSQPYTTRAQAAEYQGYDPKIIEAMAERQYEAEKLTGSSLPPWSRVEDSHKASLRRGLVAALREAEKSGYLKRAGA